MTETSDRDIDVFRQSLVDALPSANVPTLLLLLFQFTGDERWLLPPFTPEKSRWDDNDSGGLLPSMQEEARRRRSRPSWRGRRGRPSPSRTFRPTS